MFELLNSEGWITFIGDRNVSSPGEAVLYIRKILDSHAIDYWVVRLKETGTPVGIISFIKREYLDHHDLGFAFLPEFMGKGYAKEAAGKVLFDKLNGDHPVVFATTVPGNAKSIRLLLKLGFSYSKEVIANHEKLLVYKVTTDKLVIDRITATFFMAFANREDGTPKLHWIGEVCIPALLVVKKSQAEIEAYNMESFLEPRRAMLTDGTLVDFAEWETEEHTDIEGNIAQRRSVFRKRGVLNGVPFDQTGSKFFQFVRTDKGWRISSVIWEDMP